MQTREELAVTITITITYCNGESVALLVASRTDNRKVVGSMPANVVCIHSVDR